MGASWYFLRHDLTPQAVRFDTVGESLDAGRNCTSERPLYASGDRNFASPWCRGVSFPAATTTAFWSAGESPPTPPS